MELQKIRPNPEPKAELEQYSTPADIAADILFHAFTNGDITNKKIVDLGCGTGIFSIGSALLSAEEVLAVDIDQKVIDAAKKEAKRFDVFDKIKFITKDVEDIKTEADTIVMNPPFGSQNRGADIPFLEKAFDIAPRIYSLHNAKTEDFLRKFINTNGYSIFWEKRYMFGVDRIFRFHKKEREEFEVILFAIERK